MGRLASQILGVICVGVGVGLLAWGISSGVIEEPVSGPFSSLPIFPSASAVIGWGAGILAVGLSTLILTFMNPPFMPWEE